MKAVRPLSHLDAAVNIPGSKSISHRALIAAGLAEGESRLHAILDCEDTLHTAAGLRTLGLQVSWEGEEVVVSGNGGIFAPVQGTTTCFLGNSGTSFRLLLSIAALAGGRYLFTGTPRMRERPIGDLVKALKDLGVEASCQEKGGFPPVLIEAKGIPGGRVGIAGNTSSQYISSLLLAGPYMEKGVEIDVIGELVSRPYLDITVDVMNRFGVEVGRNGYASFKVAPGQRYQPRRYRVDGDVSSASYFWAAAAVTGGAIHTENIHHETTRQGDILLLDVLEAMGCRVRRAPERITIQGAPLSGLEADMGAMPDMVPTLSAIALFARGRTTIRNVPHLRHKESDRLACVALEWRRLGARIEELPDGLIIHGGERLSGAMVDPHDDHRLAMSLAVVGLKVPGIVITNESSVIKSFPRFWDLWDSLAGEE
jgi:3-phosphoshikimate 1-carboxyvinyltransferase